MQEVLIMIFSSYGEAKAYKHNNRIEGLIIMFPLGMNGSADYIITDKNGNYYTKKGWIKLP